MSEVDVQYEKLKGLIDGLTRICEENKMVNLREAESNLKANQGNVGATDSLERNLRGVRVRILSNLSGLIKNFGGQ